MGWWSSCGVFVVVVVMMMMAKEGLGSTSSSEVRKKVVAQHDDADALTKSILFFEGQRSGKLPSTQRMTWRKDSALLDGHDAGVDLVGGYYDAGDNIKFNFPMAFTTTILAWGVLEFGEFMDSNRNHAIEAIQWATDYLMKATSVPNVVYVQVAQPYKDHNCWERPEDMDTERAVYSVNQTHPGSEVSAEIAAALAASSMVFKDSNPKYSRQLRNRAIEVFEFADKYQGNYNDSLGLWVCPFYCDWGGYQDELLWGAVWLYKATQQRSYWDYVTERTVPISGSHKHDFDSDSCEFGWDDKHAGVHILMYIETLKKTSEASESAKEYYRLHSEQFICSVLPESPTKPVTYSPGGLMHKPGGSNMQNPTALSFLLLVYAHHFNKASEIFRCGNALIVRTSESLTSLVKSQVDYILGDNPMNMSYMVGYGHTFPNRIHHRGSSLPSMDQHPQRLQCQDGKPYFESPNPNPNLLIGAVVGGPPLNDSYPDSRSLFVYSEPTTYINAPLVGVLAYIKAHHSQ